MTMDPAAELLVLKAAGLDVLEIARLARLRLLIHAGTVHEETTEYRRARFGLWLYEHHRFEGDDGP